MPPFITFQCILGLFQYRAGLFKKWRHKRFYLNSQYQQVYFGEAKSLCDQVCRNGDECRLATVEDVIQLNENQNFHDFLDGKNENKLSCLTDLDELKGNVKLGKSRSVLVTNNCSSCQECSIWKCSKINRKLSFWIVSLNPLPTLYHAYSRIK
jgi:hypothetical protein